MTKPDGSQPYGEEFSRDPVAPLHGDPPPDALAFGIRGRAPSDPITIALNQNKQPETRSGIVDTPPADHTVPDSLRSREKKLVELARGGEASAIDVLYRTHYDSIFRYAVIRLRSLSAAEDVTSRVFLGMLDGLPRYKDHGRPFAAWLYAIAHKQIARYYRDRNRSLSLEPLEGAEELIADTAGPHATAEERERRVAVARALRLMPDGQRQVITLRYLFSLSLAETAAVIGRSEGAVKKLQARGLAELRELLQNGGLEPPS